MIRGPVGAWSGRPAAKTCQLIFCQKNTLAKNPGQKSGQQIREKFGHADRPYIKNPTVVQPSTT